MLEHISIIYVLITATSLLIVMHSIKKIVFKHVNDPEIIFQSERCYMNDFSVDSSVGFQYPSTKGTKAELDDAGKLVFTHQERLCSSSLL